MQVCQSLSSQVWAAGESYCPILQAGTLHEVLLFISSVLESWSFVSPVTESWSHFTRYGILVTAPKRNYHVLHSQHIHTHMVFSMKEAASGATLPIPSTLSITTNSDSLVEFFIHPCKFLKYSISFSFN